MPRTEREQVALDALDEQGLIAALRELLRIPSVTGQEAAAQRWLGQHMQQLGLEVDLWPIDVAEMQRHPRFPGMEVDRNGSEALGLVGAWHGSSDLPRETGKRLIFNGHIDVVPVGDPANWQHSPLGAELEDGRIYGRGACDMKGGLMAALYALKAIKDSGVPLAGSLLIESVIGEEDGGLGTFATLQRGYTGDAAIVCEPTSLNLIPAQAGALTFTVRVSGKSAHACVRLEGVSAIEKYLDIHRALLQLERERNSEVEHPLLGQLELPYPLSIGRVQAGNWSSSVPEELTFEGRIGVAMGESSAAVRQQFEQTLANLAETDPWLRDHPLAIEWSGGQFDSGETPLDSPLVDLCRQTLLDLIGHAPQLEGAPYGSDLRLLVNQGRIPTLLFGPGNVRIAHMPDEFVRVDEVLLAAKAYVVAALRFLEVGK
ncbi:MAG TPA: ArgE/DapE family deacylase [Ktedonobacteraceae bacterium]|nr:ArgE/DapE family deacylase [Ktedonobacteraceae bacterium]